MALICLAPTCTMELFCYSVSERWWGTVDILPYSLLIGNSLYKPDRHDHKPESVLDGVQIIIIIIMQPRACVKMQAE